MRKRPLETYHRSALKAISYRVLSIGIDSAVAYLFTRNVVLSASIVLVANLYSTVLYYVHERFWARVHWGRQG